MNMRWFAVITFTVSMVLLVISWSPSTTNAQEPQPTNSNAANSNSDLGVDVSNSAPSIHPENLPENSSFISIMSGQLTDFGQVLGEASVSALAIGTDDKIYGGTHWNGHLFVFDPTDSSVTDLGIPSGQGILVLTWDTNGILYGGGQQGYLWTYDPATDSFSNKGQVPGEMRIIGLTSGNDGTIYIGTECGCFGVDGKLFSFNPATGTFNELGTIANEGSLGYGLLTAPDGKIYGGTSEATPQTAKWAACDVLAR